MASDRDDGLGRELEGADAAARGGAPAAAIVPARGQRDPAWQSAEDPSAPRWPDQVDPIALTTEDGF